jgi:hypothetical protein
MIWYGIEHDMVWYGVIENILSWFGFLWYGVVLNVVQNGAVWYSIELYTVVMV